MSNMGSNCNQICSTTQFNHQKYKFNTETTLFVTGIINTNLRKKSLINGHQNTKNENVTKVQWKKEQEKEGEEEGKVNNLEFRNNLIYQQKWYHDLVCTICCDNLQQKTSIVLQRCGHYFHIQCVKPFYQQKLDFRQYQLECPEEECGKRIAFSDFCTIFQINEQKYKGFLYNYRILSCQNCKHCLLYQNNDDQFVICTKCQSKHLSSTTFLEQTESLKQEDWEYIKSNNIQMCPICKFWIEKNGGCDHITCRCGYNGHLDRNNRILIPYNETKLRDLIQLEVNQTSHYKINNLSEMFENLDEKDKEKLKIIQEESLLEDTDSLWQEYMYLNALQEEQLELEEIIQRALLILQNLRESSQ